MNRDLPDPSGKRDYVQAMFGRIAQRYDLLNKILSFGFDSKWRKRVVNILQPEEEKTYLDVGCGTGDLAKEIIQFQSTARVIAADLTYPMIVVGKTRIKHPGIFWIVADAEALPFADGIFHGVVSGYLIRNVPNPGKTLEEQNRVMRPAVKNISLDTTPPQDNWFRPFLGFYFRIVIPFIGQWISRDKNAYSYLSNSTINHLSADHLATIYRETGFLDVTYIKLMFGTMAIHFGIKR